MVQDGSKGFSLQRWLFGIYMAKLAMRDVAFALVLGLFWKT